MNLYFMNGIYKLPRGGTRRIVEVMRSICPSVSFGLDPAMILHSDAKTRLYFKHRERKSSQMNSSGFKENVHPKNISFCHHLFTIFNPKPSDWLTLVKQKRRRLDECSRCSFHTMEVNGNQGCQAPKMTKSIIKIIV